MDKSTAAAGAHANSTGDHPHQHHYNLATVLAHPADPKTATVVLFCSCGDVLQRSVGEIKR